MKARCRIGWTGHRLFLPNTAVKLCLTGMPFLNDQFIIDIHECKVGITFNEVDYRKALDEGLLL